MSCLMYDVSCKKCNYNNLYHGYIEKCEKCGHTELHVVKEFDEWQDHPEEGRKSGRSPRHTRRHKREKAMG